MMDRLFAEHVRTLVCVRFTRIHTLLGDARVELTRLDSLAGVREVRELVIQADRLLYSTADLR